MEATAELLAKTDEFLLYTDSDMIDEEVYYKLLQMNVHLKFHVMTMLLGYCRIENLKNSLS